MKTYYVLPLLLLGFASCTLASNNSSEPATTPAVVHHRAGVGSENGNLVLKLPETSSDVVIRRVDAGDLPILASLSSADDERSTLSKQIDSVRNEVTALKITVDKEVKEMIEGVDGRLAAGLSAASKARNALDKKIKSNQNALSALNLVKTQVSCLNRGPGYALNPAGKCAARVGTVDHIYSVGQNRYKNEPWTDSNNRIMTDLTCRECYTVVTLTTNVFINQRSNTWGMGMRIKFNGNAGRTPFGDRWIQNLGNYGVMAYPSTQNWVMSAYDKRTVALGPGTDIRIQYRGHKGGSYEVGLGDGEKTETSLMVVQYSPSHFSMKRWMACVGAASGSCVDRVFPPAANRWFNVRDRLLFYKIKDANSKLIVTYSDTIGQRMAGDSRGCSYRLTYNGKPLGKDLMSSGTTSRYRYGLEFNSLSWVMDNTALRLGKGAAVRLQLQAHRSGGAMSCTFGFPYKSNTFHVREVAGGPKFYAGTRTPVLPESFASFGPGITSVSNLDRFGDWEQRTKGKWQDIPGRTLTVRKMDRSSQLMVTYQDTIGYYSRNNVNTEACRVRMVVNGRNQGVKHVSFRAFKVTGWHMKARSLKFVTKFMDMKGKATIKFQSYNLRGNSYPCVFGWKRRSSKDPNPSFKYQYSGAGHIISEEVAATATATAA